MKNPLDPITIKASSAWEAYTIGIKKLQEIINEDRFKRSFTQEKSCVGKCGSYNGKINEIIDSKGRLVYPVKNRNKN